MYDIKEWRHVFKLDPNKEISDDELEQICESGTDAVIVGGTDGVNSDNVLNLLARIRRYTVPCILEVSTVESVTPGFDFYFIPMVLNSGKREWIIGLHHEAVKEYGDIMNWDEIVVEGYCILNKEAKAAQLTEADAELSADDVVAYAQLAERMLHLPIFYIEYSGLYGNPLLVKRVKETLTTARLFYGGGIERKEQAVEMSQWADTIVVGNIIYKDLQAALETVQAAKNTVR